MIYVRAHSRFQITPGREVSVRDGKGTVIQRFTKADTRHRIARVRLQDGREVDVRRVGDVRVGIAIERRRAVRAVAA